MVARVKAPITRSTWRAVARKEWGHDWWVCHPVIKKARMEWAIRQVTDRARDCFSLVDQFRTSAEAIKREGRIDLGRVVVKEASGKQYTV